MLQSASQLYECSIHLQKGEQVVGMLVSLVAPHEYAACVAACRMASASPDCQRHGWRVIQAVALKPDPAGGGR